MSNNQLIENNIVDKVQSRVEKMTNQGELHLPENYSPQNALKSAWLILQDVKTSNNKPALQACNKSSIANALLKMIVMGLNPEKKQCYFIPYGNKLVCQPSYFGSIKVAKSAANVKEVYPQVIYDGDELETEINRGTEKIINHKRPFKNRLAGEVIGAYCIVEFEDDRPDHTEIMTMGQIKAAWSQGQIYKEGKKGTTHERFTEEMAKKTVINRACKRVINSSDDSNLVIDAFNEPGGVQTEHKVQEEIEENANSQIFDIEVEEEEPEPQPEQAEPEPENEQPKQEEKEGPDFV